MGVKDKPHINYLRDKGNLIELINVMVGYLAQIPEKERGSATIQVVPIKDTEGNDDISFKIEF